MLAVQQNLDPVQQLVYESCLVLNDGSWKEYLELCNPESFRYRIMTYSPEILKDQTWVDRDFKALEKSFKLRPKHNSDHMVLTRQAVVYKVDGDERGEVFNVTSGLTVYRTECDGYNSHLDSGQTHVYAVGTYRDRISVTGDAPKLLERIVRLDTRQLGTGCHYIF